MRIGFILFPQLTQLDLTGPAEVFARLPGAQVELLWKDLSPVSSDRGMRILPTQTFAQCEGLDVICVPGGPGQVALMDDALTLAFIARMAHGCQWVTSVCTGSLVLGAAGLLQGYRATSHWASIDQLELLGAIPVNERVVRDRNRLTGAGVTSGIDFALTLVANLVGEGAAKAIQLQMEYDPAPPFDTGSPRLAPAGMVAAARRDLHDFIERRRAATQRAATRLCRAVPTAD